MRRLFSDYCRVQGKVSYLPVLRREVTGKHFSLGTPFVQHSPARGFVSMGQPMANVSLLKGAIRGGRR